MALPVEKLAGTSDEILVGKIENLLNPNNNVRITSDTPINKSNNLSEELYRKTKDFGVFDVYWMPLDDLKNNDSFIS